MRYLATEAGLQVVRERAFFMFKAKMISSDSNQGC